MSKSFSGIVNPYNTTVSVKFSEEIMEFIDKQVIENRTHRSTFVREIVEKYVTSQCQAPTEGQ